MVVPADQEHAMIRHDIASDRIDDTLCFRLSSSRTVPRTNVGIGVEVVALVDATDTDHGALESRVLGALTAFIRSDWTISSIERTRDDSGYERVLLRAHTRVGLDENHNLEERGRRASGSGLAIQSPRVDFSLPPQVLVAETERLQDELVLVAMERAKRFTELTGRTWRLGEVRFGVQDASMQNYSAKNIGRELATASEEGGLGMAERLLLLADVTLKSAA
jgi:hypothetical protein